MTRAIPNLRMLQGTSRSQYFIFEALLSAIPIPNSSQYQHKTKEANVVSIFKAGDENCGVGW